MNDQQIILSVKNVNKTFKTSGGEVAAIKNATFDIAEGSFVIVYGPSGSGKSSLLNCLVGLSAPTTGTITFEGKDLYGMLPNERAYFRAHTMGMVHQTNYWIKSLNVVENVALPLTFLGFSQQDAEKGAMDSLRRINMEQFAFASPIKLSGGEQQRIAMARATVNNPSYIVADEPTGNLDTTNGDSIIELLRYFNKRLRRTVILVTHNPEYLPVGDQLMTIHNGEVGVVVGSDIQGVTEQLVHDTFTRMDHWKEMV